MRSGTGGVASAEKGYLVKGKLYHPACARIPSPAFLYRRSGTASRWTERLHLAANAPDANIDISATCSRCSASRSEESRQRRILRRIPVEALEEQLLLQQGAVQIELRLSSSPKT